MLAASPTSLALAQNSNQPSELPGIVVEGQKAKKKPTAAKKSSAPKPTQAATPTPVQAPASPQSPTSPFGPTASTPGGNPYADPSAPYKADRSANTKLTEPLLDTPRTVTTVTKETLEDKNATAIRELMRTTPGVTLGTGEGGNAFGDVFYIRGFKATSDTYVDGIRDPSISVRENFNTEQVEILKGPSSSISGRGTTGGAVNIITKQAQDENFQHMTTTLGTDDTRRVTADVNQVFSKEFAVRANGMWQEADIAGRDEVYDDRWGGALAAAWTPTSNFRLTADYYHLDLDAIPDYGVPWDRNARKPVTETVAGRDNFYGVADRDFLSNQQDLATVKAELELIPGLLLSSRFRYGDTEHAYVATAPEAPNVSNPNPALWTYSANAKSRYQENEILANQTDVTAKFQTAGISHTLVAGVEFSEEQITQDGYQGLRTEVVGVPSNIGSCPGINIINPNTSSCWNSATQKLVRARNFTYIDVVTQSAYILDTVKIGRQWILTGGARIDNYDIDVSRPNTRQNYGRDDLMFNWNGAVTYKPLPNGSIYFAYGTSSNPTGQEFDATSEDYGGITPRSVALAPEQNEAYEVGTKWELFSRHLLATAAVFQTTKENAREIPPGAGNTVLYQDTGEYRVRGIELGVAGNITESLSIWGGLVLLDSEILKSANPAAEGKELANIAHETFTLLAKYQLSNKLSVGGQASYASEIFGGTLAALPAAGFTTPNEIPEHWRFDAMLEYELTKNIEVQVNGLNLTNETYYEGIYRSGTPFSYIAPGRAGYVSMNFKY